MQYSLYKLNFTTALHIGSDKGSASLSNVQMSIHSDTVFAALCCEAARQGTILELVQEFASGRLTISDALPYRKNTLYLPKPIIFTGSKKQEKESNLKKALKSLEYIALPLFKQYVKEISNDQLTDPAKYQYEPFGKIITLTRVALKGQSIPSPYHVSAWQFTPGCGLYIILAYEQPQDVALFEKLLNNLALTGIGGKQSSGWGKFEITKNSVPPELFELLNDEKSAYQMLLGTALPEEEKIDEILAGGWYTLVRRGGFVRSETYASQPLKKRTIYMLAPGSCLRKRFQGGMFDLSVYGSHSVWRCGSTLFAGVKL